MAQKPNVIVFASGTKTGGGSGARNLVLKSRGSNPELKADIVAFVSEHAEGGVSRYANDLGIPFEHLKGPFPTSGLDNAAALQDVVDTRATLLAQKYKADFVVLSGFIKRLTCFDPATTINIHPALLSQLGGKFGGKGMYGHRVHEAVKAALDRGELGENPSWGFTMHFVTHEYDRGPVFAEVRVPIQHGMTAEAIGKAVNEAEHRYQPRLTHMVVNRLVRLVDGKVEAPFFFMSLM